MSNLKLPGEDDKKKGASTTRVVIWIVVGGIGVWYLLQGVIGVATSG